MAWEEVVSALEIVEREDSSPNELNHDEHVECDHFTDVVSSVYQQLRLHFEFKFIFKSP